MELSQTIPSDVVRRLGYYVYAYVNPLNGQIFYVGKGKGRRVLSHLSDRTESRKVETVKQIRAAGKQPQLEILAHGLRNADIALQVEAAVIDALGRRFLTNQVRGWHSSNYGRAPLEDLIALYRRRPVQITEPSILIRISELYRPGMSDAEMYDATRGDWVIGPKRERAKYAMSVYAGVVREVYAIAGWFPAGTTFMSRRDRLGLPGRWEFVGRPAPKRVRLRYVNRDVSGYFKQGNQNPITYVKIQ
ncbi:MAG TPA: hypothetical protein VEU52_02595 [Candidatus Limnocylindrales bacterium]|nr:hypothetical protein [Candidatus Limnocylindrales bacterium]